MESSGFASGQVSVVPRPQVLAALRQPATRQLTVVGAGYYRRARGHKRGREKGTRDVIVILCTAGTGTVEIGDLTRMLMSRGRPLARVRSVDRAVALFDELLSLLERRLSPAHILASSGVAWQLLTRLAADSALPSEDSPLERAIRYLESRVDGAIRVDDLADLVGLSAAHLTAQFRKATGGGPVAFHTGLKMARARTLLDTTSRPISDVALAVGYTDSLYFSRRFRRHHGISPSAYRAQAKG